MRQGYEEPRLDDFVLIRDEKKHHFTKYGAIMKISENDTKALVKTKKQPNGAWFIIPMLFPLVTLQMTQ